MNQPLLDQSRLAISNFYFARWKKNWLQQKAAVFHLRSMHNTAELVDASKYLPRNKCAAACIRWMHEEPCQENDNGTVSKLKFDCAGHGMELI